MAKKQFNSFNWLEFFQFLDTTKGRITLISSMLGIGWAFGYHSANLINNRDIILLERNINQIEKKAKEDLINQKEKNIKFYFDNKKLELENLKLKDSLRNGKR